MNIRCGSTSYVELITVAIRPRVYAEYWKRQILTTF